MSSLRARRTLTLGTLASLCALVGTLAFSSAPALALETHVFSSSFAGSGANALSDPQGVAIDQSTGEVYVVDSANDRVEIFSSSGAFISAFGSAGGGDGEFKEPSQIAVDNSTGLPGDVYVLDQGNERVEVFNAKGVYQSRITTAEFPKASECDCVLGEVGSLRGIAVDAGGDLWISTEAPSQSNTYELVKGESIPSFVFGSGETIGFGLAIDSSGDLYHGGPSVKKTGPGGEALATFNHGSGAANAVAVDPASEDVYVARGTSVARFLASGDSFSDTFGSGGPNALLAGSGIAVMGSTGVVYVADLTRHRVDVFDPTTIPDVTLEAPTAVTQTAASLHGAVNPAGIAVTACEFEYRSESEPEFGQHSVACSPSPGSGTASVAVEAPVGSLLAATTYHYRLVATDANGINYGQEEEESFTTPFAVQGLSTGLAEDVSASGAKLTGSLSPNGTDAHYYFEYSAGATPEGSCSEAAGCFISPALPGADAGTGGPKCEPPGGAECSPVPAETTLSGLAANTTYHYRLVGVDSFGTTYGSDATFQTFGPPIVDSESAEVNPAEKTGQTRATLQAQITPDSLEGHETTYQFQYGKTSSYGTSVPVPTGDIGSGESIVQVPATELSGLEIDTTYHYRVVAINEYGTTDGPDQTFTTLPAALIEESASEVTATSAILEAQVNPLGTSTTCQFQYVTDAGFHSTGYATATSLPCPAALGAGESAVEVAPQHIEGLSPGTVYDYRAIATNALGTVDGPDQTFTTQTAGELVLPDDRQWEMVSPPAKHGALIEPILGEFITQAAAGGGAMAFSAGSPIESEPQGYALGAQALAVRGADGGWSARDLAVPHEVAAHVPVGPGNEFQHFSADLSHVTVHSLGSLIACRSSEGAAQPCLSAQATEQTPFVQSTFSSGNPAQPCVQPSGPSLEAGAASCFEPLVTAADDTAKPFQPFGQESMCAPPLIEDPYCGPDFVGATPDLSHVVLDSPVALTSTTNTNGLYEWSAGEPPVDRLQPFYLLPKSEGGEGVSPSGANPWERELSHQLSDDGSVFFDYGGHLYVHDPAKDESFRLDVAQGVAEPTAGDAEFLYAGADGSEVLFKDAEQLTSTAGGGIYECRIVEVAGALTCGELELTDLESTGFSTGVFVGGSVDASYLYFLGAEDKLYLDHYNGSEWKRTFIAALSSSDEPDWAVGLQGNLGERTSRVSPNGRWLAFMSRQSLTGYDSHDALNGKPDEEVYLYHAPESVAEGSGSHPPTLVCASCDPSGARPVGEEVLYSEGNAWQRIVDAAVWEPAGPEGGGSSLAADIPGWESYALSATVYQPRYLSDSGRLFFNARDPLVPQAVNGNWDVYQYEPEGVGPSGAACGPAVASGSEVFKPERAVEVEGRGVVEGAGCVGLISSGESPHASAFLDASENGGEVFFLTSAKLVKQDTDNAYDVYDAHECTSESPCPPPAASEPPECTTEASCKAAPEAQPSIFGLSGSATFSDAGNQIPLPPAVIKKVTKKTVKCERGFVKDKKGRCVKAKIKKKKNKAKKSAHTNRRAGR